MYNFKDSSVATHFFIKSDTTICILSRTRIKLFVCFVSYTYWYSQIILSDFIQKIRWYYMSSWILFFFFPEYLHVYDFICFFHLPVFSMAQLTMFLCKFGMFTTVIPFVEKMSYDDLVKSNFVLSGRTCRWTRCVCLMRCLGTQSAQWTATQTCWVCPCWRLQLKWIELMFLYQNSQNLKTRTKRMIWVKIPWQKCIMRMHI